VTEQTLFYSVGAKTTTKMHRKFKDWFVKHLPGIGPGDLQVVSQDEVFTETLHLTNAQVKHAFWGWTEHQRQRGTGFFRYLGKQFFVVGPNMFDAARRVNIYVELLDQLNSTEAKLNKAPVIGKDGVLLDSFAANVQSVSAEFPRMNKWNAADRAIVLDTLAFYEQRRLFESIRMAMTRPPAGVRPTFRRMGTRRVAAIPGTPIEWARLVVESRNRTCTTVPFVS